MLFLAAELGTKLNTKRSKCILLEVHKYKTNFFYFFRYLQLLQSWE
jgi:hypothetical protein